MASQTQHIPFFDTAAHEAYAWVDDISNETGWNDRHYAFQALRGVLHALRDEITVDQSGHLCAQLPTLIRGIYFEGWDPSRAPAVDRAQEAFVDRVRPYFAGYSESVDLTRAAQAVLSVLERRMPGPMDKIRGTLPKGLRGLWPVN
ncbi:MAG: DUF2267 domain-containing protein [Vulcanimicrobiaceae bacterium]